MEKHEYKKMFSCEKNLWWYKNLRLFLKQELNKLIKQRQKKQIKILDAGCGTGGNLKMLQKIGFKKTFGFDVSKKAISFCKKRELKNIKLGSINKIPFEKNSFDIVICINVLESQEVNLKKAFKELIRVLKPKGSLLLVLSAHQYLLSEHDLAVHSVQRFNKKKVLKYFSSSKSKIVWQKYYFFFLFPFIAIIRILKNILFKLKGSKKPQSDVKKSVKWLNSLFYSITKKEADLAKYISFPWGSSLFVLIKKE